MGKGARFEELLKEFAEIFCNLGDYDWNSDFGDKTPDSKYVVLPTFEKASGN